MIVEAIRLKDFLSHAESEVDFRDSPLWLIAGDNGAGKSALFDAVELALYGSHRGGNQHHGLLVKQGKERGLVEIEARIDGALHRITHHLDRKRGNVGSSVERMEGGDWRSVSADNGLETATKVWKWLEPLVPSHDLFRAAIYLRQGEAGYFMSGSAPDRMKRFAALLDLSRYTEISTRAKERSASDRRKQEDAQSRLDGLGDNSDDRLASLQETLKEKKADVSTAETLHEIARHAREQAKAWNDKVESRRKLEEEWQGLQDLLTQEKKISEDAEVVSGWDRVATDLSRYWDRHEDAARCQAKAADTRQEAAALEAEAETQGRELAKAEDDSHTLTEELLSAASQSAGAAGAHADYLRREAEIARARERAVVTGRLALLLELRAVADARHRMDEACSVEADARDARDRAGDECTRIRMDIERLDVEIDGCDGKVRCLSKFIEELSPQVARLAGRIESHGSLDASAPECPVCAQPIDESAHARLRTVLADEERRLEARSKDLQTAEEERRTAGSEFEKARKERKEAAKEEKAANGALAGAAKRISDAGVEAHEAQSRWESARDALIENHPNYISPPEEITPQWLAEREPVLAEGLDRSVLGVATPNSARLAVVQVRSRLETLQGQRSDGAEPLGDVRASADLASAMDAAEKEAGRLADEVTRLVNCEEKLKEQAQKLDTEIAGLRAQAKVLDREATGDVQDADKADVEAEQIRGRLGADWQSVLAEKAVYDANLQDIESRRPSADRAPELAQARGRIQGIEQDLTEVATDLEKIDPEHRIPVADAKTREDEARGVEQEARGIATEASLAVKTLEANRCQAIEYRQTITEAGQMAETYALLAELLKEGGAIQVDVARREQRAIIHEVNAVLSLIHDPLRVRLGEARRATRQGLQDILAVDTGDPIGEPRYFAFLSGGEQFRVSLALALALHRRVAKGGAGTLIVDEGFGALDGNRRDELAREMSDTTCGLLQQGLANSILISSHSVEVRRHFPYRWLVTKVAGTANVEAVEEESILFNES